MSTLRVALIGCGKIAEQHVWAIRRIPLAELVGVCDRERLMAEQLAERSGVARYSDDLHQFLKSARPDVVHITTPPQSHLDLASACLEAGCHVYVEKPFTLNTDEAVGLITMAEQRGLQITAGHNAQFNWENVCARDRIKEGFLGGPPVHIESYYTYGLGDARYAKALLGDKAHWVRSLPGKLLHNIISHGIARIAEYMTSEAPHVSAFGYSSPLLLSIGETEIVDELRVQIADGVNLTAAFVFSSQLRPPVNGCRFYGPRNSLVVDNVHHTVVCLQDRAYKSYANYVLPPLHMAREYFRGAGSNVRRFLASEFHDDSGLKNLIEAFYRSVLGVAPAPFGYDQILRTSRMMDAIFDQLRQQTAPTREPVLQLARALD